MVVVSSVRDNLENVDTREPFFTTNKNSGRQDIQKKLETIRIESPTADAPVAGELATRGERRKRLRDGKQSLWMVARIITSHVRRNT